jgi:hypothetical protein
LIERLAVRNRKLRPGRCGRLGGRRERLGRDPEDELLRGQVVVRPGVDPEQLGVPLKLLEGRGIHAARIRKNRLQHLAHLEVVAIALVIKDVAPGNGGLSQVPDQRLVFERQRRKPVRIQLHDRGIVNPFEEVLLGLGGGARRGGGRRLRRGVRAGGGDEGQQREKESFGHSLMIGPTSTRRPD